MSILANRLPVSKPRDRKPAERHGVCELFLKIHVNSHRTASFYRVKPLTGFHLAGTAFRAWELQTPTGKRYCVSRDPEGHLSCDCPDFIFVRAHVPGACKHCAALTAAGLL